MSGVLYVVATPLGNLSDLSARVIETLKAVDLVYAEDTRRTKTLLNHIGSTAPLESLHQHNEHERVGGLVRRLGEGQSLALVSDAGTPGVSDPGAIAVAAARDEGYEVRPIPGPSALATALSVCGFLADEVLFAGFLPAKGKDRQVALDRVAATSGLVVLYEGPHRIVKTLRDIGALTPERRICLCRELTKMHEEIRWGLANELATWADEAIRGEITLVLDAMPIEAVAADEAEIDAALGRCLAGGMSARDAAAAVAAVLEVPRKLAYGRCQRLKG